MRLHTAFRGAAARGNYLSSDRIDTQFSCKEVCRHMSSPTDLSWKALKRIGRYLAGRPRLVCMFNKQSTDHLDIYIYILILIGPDAPGPDAQLVVAV